MLTRIRKAQSTLEYALLISVVVGGLLTMQNYLKRSIQGKLRASADDIGEQYSPGLVKRTDTMSSTMNIREETNLGGSGKTITNILQGSKQSQNSTREIKSLDKEVWVGQNK